MKCLIVIDVQNGFVSDATKHILGSLERRMREFRESGDGLILATQFHNTEESGYTQILHWPRMKSSPETDLIPFVGDLADAIVEKVTYSACSEDVVNFLWEHKVTEVMLAGIDTDCCVLSTAIHLFDLGFRPVVLVPCCASNGGPTSHEAALTVLKRVIGEDQLCFGEYLGSDLTLQYYDDHAERFAADTIGADMEEIRTRFLAHLPAGARILDFGCGAGRDAKAFRDLAYEVTAIDGAESLCRIAGAHAGIPVRCEDFRNYYPAPGEAYEGIWACASLLHLEKVELLPVLKSLAKALVPGGVLYVSFKYGEFEGERRGRYFTDFTPEGFREYMKDIPELTMVESWVTGDVRSGRGDERWTNMIWEKR